MIESPLYTPSMHIEFIMFAQYAFNRGGGVAVRRARAHATWHMMSHMLIICPYVLHCTAANSIHLIKFRTKMSVLTTCCCLAFIDLGS